MVNVKREREREREIYQVFVDNELAAVTKVRMAAIKIRNLVQNNGGSAVICTTDREHASKHCLELLECLEMSKNFSQTRIECYFSS